MKNPKEINLNKSYRVRQSIWILISQILIIEFILLIFFLLINSFEFTVPNENNNYQNLFITLILQIINIILVIIVILKWFTIYYIVSPQDISSTKGILFKKTITTDLRSIASVQVQQNIIGRIFQYGTLKMENPLLKDNFYLENISSPYKHAKIIEKQRIKEAGKHKNPQIVPL